MKVRRGLKREKGDLTVLRRLFTKYQEETNASYCRIYLEERNEEDPDRGLSEENFDREKRQRCDDLHVVARAIAEEERVVQAFSRIEKLFSFWRKVHIYLAVFLFSVITVHIFTALYYGLRWAR